MSRENNTIIEIDIDRLTEAELLDLNHRIVQRLRFLDQMRAHGTMMNFQRGEQVRFRDKRGRWVRGILAKYNQKTVTVLSEDGAQWNVNPSLIERASEGHRNADKREPIEICPVPKK
jgi:hypothetical protein